MRDDRGAVGLDWGSQDPQDPLATPLPDVIAAQ